jgi:hypothetical protein
VRNIYWVLRGRVVSPQAGGPPTVGCPRLLIQYIRSDPPYLEAVSSIRNRRTRHAVVTVAVISSISNNHMMFAMEKNFFFFCAVWTSPLPMLNVLLARQL